MERTIYPKFIAQRFSNLCVQVLHGSLVMSMRTHIPQMPIKESNDDAIDGISRKNPYGLAAIDFPSMYTVAIMTLGWCY